MKPEACLNKSLPPVQKRDGSPAGARASTVSVL